MNESWTIQEIKQKACQLERNSAQIFFKADGDKYIRQFIELKEYIEEKEKEIKELIKKSGWNARGFGLVFMC